MSITSTAKVSISWDPPSRLVQGSLDYVFAGSLVSTEVADLLVDRYEVELYSTPLNDYVGQGYFYVPLADIFVGDVDNVKVRIRALLRDETKTPWVVSGTLTLSQFQADFDEPDNAIFLSII
jgi:hypothetical protein